MAGPLQRPYRADPLDPRDAGAGMQPAHVPDLAAGRRGPHPGLAGQRQLAERRDIIAGGSQQLRLAARQFAGVIQGPGAHRDHQGQQRIHLAQIQVNHLRLPRPVKAVSGTSGWCTAWPRSAHG